MQERSQETRTNIVNAGLALFSRQGYDATGVAEICTEAGVSKGAFYHHFPTKQAVFVSILEDWLQELDEQMTAMVASTGNIPQALLKMATLTHGIFTAANGHLSMFIEFWDQSLHDPEIWKTTVTPYRRYTEIFAGFIRKGIAEGSIRDVDADVAARTIIGLAIGILAQGLMDPEAAEWDKVTVKSMQFFIDGLKRRDE
jgi:AcrR family transcriptional regulator